MSAYLAPAGYFLLLIMIGRLVVSGSDIGFWMGLIFVGLIVGLGAFILLVMFEWRLVGSFLSNRRNKIT